MFALKYFGDKFKKYFKKYKRKYTSNSSTADRVQLGMTNKFASSISKEKDFKPDVILLHDTLASKAGLKMHQNFSEAKLVMDVTEIPDLNERASANLRNLSNGAKKKFKKWEFGFIDKSKQIFTLNESFKSFIQERYGRDDVEVIKNVREKIKPKHHNIRELFNVGKNDILVVFAGMASPDTGAIPTISAFAKLPSNYHLLFLGNATNNAFMTSLKNNVKSKKLLERVHFHPPVYGNEYNDILGQCDIGLVTFKTYILQTKLVLPNRFLDFVAAELPVLTTNMVDVEKYVSEYDIGQVIGNPSPENIVEGIKKLVKKYNVEGNCKIDKSFKTRIKTLSDDILESNDFEVFGKKVRSLVDKDKKPKLAFLARQRVHSNTRIARQCKALVDQGFDLKLYGINEGPDENLLKEMGNVKTKIFKI